MIRCGIYIVSAVLAIAAGALLMHPSRQAPPPSVPGLGDHPAAALEYRYDMLRGALPFLDPMARQRALAYADEHLRPAASLRKPQSITGWSALGPGNIGGRIRAIVLRPSNPSEILIGSVSGGIWKSSDGGASWSPRLDNASVIPIGSMVNIGDVVYAGTGEGWFNIDAVYGGGVYKSTDFGDSWTLLPSTTGSAIWQFRNVLRMAVDASGNVYAVTKAYNYKGGVGSYYTSGGLFRSTDAGSSWTEISSSSVTNKYTGTDVIPISSSIILFATNASGIWRTTNGGTSWSLVSSGLPSTYIGRIAMARQGTSNTVYAVFESTLSSDLGLRGIYKSVDAGANWTTLTRPSTIRSTGYRSYLSSQGWYDNVINVDPNNSAHLYVGGVDMMKSTNGGSSWSQLTYWHTYYGTPYVHADHHAIEFDAAASGTVFSGNDGGIYKTTNGGSSWTSLNNGLEITQFYGGAVSYTGSTYHGGTQDNGHLQYGSGTSWAETYGGDGGYAAVSQTDANTAYEEYVYLDMSKTANGGSSWASCVSGLSDAGNSSRSLFIAPFAMNPENSAVLIAGSDRMWVTSNSAGTWTRSSGTLVSGAKVSAVTVVNASANYLGFAGTTTGGIFRCTSLDPATGTDTWTNITPTGTNGAWVRRIVVDLADKQRVFACYSGYNNTGSGKHVWYSTNQGTSWTDISTGLPDVPVHSLVISPLNSSYLYVGTETGVYESTNNGGTWTTTSSGIPVSAPVDELVLQRGTNTVFAFTHGRGVFASTGITPVQLVSFDARQSGDAVALRWKTATEANNYGFEVQRACGDAIAVGRYATIAFLPGNGTKNTPSQYAATDAGPWFSADVSYRLRQLDRDGQSMTYGAVAVRLQPRNLRLIAAGQQPFRSSASFALSLPDDADCRCEVYDAGGRLRAVVAAGRMNAGYHPLRWDGRDAAGGRLPAGVYFLRAATAAAAVVVKFVLMP